MRGVKAFLCCCVILIARTGSISAISVSEDDLVDSNVSWTPCLYNENMDVAWGSKARAFASQKRPIVVEVGDWESSRLTTSVVVLMLSEVMGYRVMVRMYTGGLPSGPRLSTSLIDLNLELWPSDSPWFALLYEVSAYELNRYSSLVRQNRTIIDQGSLGYTGRVGLYAPSYVLTRYPNLNFDFWRFFQNPEAIRVLPRPGTAPHIVDPSGGLVCDDDVYSCVNNTYTPSWYRPEDDDNFAEMWVFSPQFATNVYPRLIDGLRLNATIKYWGDGPELEAAIEEYYEKEIPILFFYWKPTPFAASILFPDDSNGQFSKFLADRKSPLKVDVPNEILYKVSSANFTKEFQELESLIQKLVITEEDMDDMLRYLVSKNASVDEIDLAFSNVRTRMLVVQPAIAQLEMSVRAILKVADLIFSQNVEEFLESESISSFLAVASLNVDGLVTDCPAPISGVDKLMFRYLFPSLLLLFLSILYGICALLPSRDLATRLAKFLPSYMMNRPVSIVFFNAFYTVATLVHMPLVEASLELLDCRTVLGKYVLREAPGTVCFSQQHLTGLVVSVIVLTLLLIVLPMTLLGVVIDAKRRGVLGVESERFRFKVLRVFIEPYASRFYFFEPIQFVEKAVIVVLFKFSNDGAPSSLIGYIILLSSLSLIRVYIQPYESKIEGYLVREIYLCWMILLAFRLVTPFIESKTLIPYVIIVLILPAFLHIARRIIQEAYSTRVMKHMMGLEAVPTGLGKEKMSRRSAKSIAAVRAGEEEGPCDAALLQAGSE
ncbi:hypothetical protein HDU67_002596 [Dinochytrium kinnereticum]|nr:hypothetical protein HDU67_002596 [Dinochytrium kinnereticum]